MQKRIPDFIGIGVVKCGTTWVHNQLRFHPQVCTPVKETHFFNEKRLTLEEYLKLFGQCPEDKICGEWTPDYFIWHDAPNKIADIAPKAKLLVMLRNPIERAWSNYKFGLWRGTFRNQTFEEAFHRVPQLRLRGLYAELLKRWYKYIPAEQIHVGFHDDAIAHPRKFMKRMYAFLGIDRKFVSPVLYENYKKQYSIKYDHLVMSRRDQKLVKDFYLESIHKLETMFDRDLSHWYNVKNT